MNFNFDPKLKAIVGDWFNGPLAIDPSYIDYMIKTINTVELMADGGLLTEKPLPSEMLNLTAKRSEGFIQAGTSAIINVQGPISYRPAGSFFRWLFGGTSYAEILESFRAAKASDKVSQIVFNIDSPGGSVVGFEDAINEIYEGSLPTMAKKTSTISSLKAFLFLIRKYAYSKSTNWQAH